jgi:hypothetical protein
MALYTRVHYLFIQIALIPWKCVYIFVHLYILGPGPGVVYCANVSIQLVRQPLIQYNHMPTPALPTIHSVSHPYIY